MRTTAGWILILTAMTVACSDDEPTRLEPTVPTPVEPSSPEAVLENLILAHEQGDIAAYDDAIADEFSFVASHAYPGVRFDRLTKTEDHIITNDMFGDIEEFDFDAIYGHSVPSDRADFPAHRGYRMIEAMITIDFTTRRTVDGEPVIWRVITQPMILVFEPDSSTVPVTYRIVYQLDQAQELRDSTPIAPVTWSWIKSQYVEAPDYLPPTSPENVLVNLMKAHRVRDIYGYTPTTAAGFRFVPSPNDTLPFDLLDKSDDDRVTRAMFEDGASCELELTYQGSEPSDRDGYPAARGYRQIDVTALFRVTTEGPDGEPQIFLFSNQRAFFIFGPDSSASPPIWRIVLQEDHGDARRELPVGIASWGSLKAHWY